MTIADAFRGFIGSRKPAAQLTEIRQRIAEAVAEVQRIDGEIARRAMAVMTGDAEAIRLCAEFKEERAEIAARIETLRLAEADRARVVAEETETARQKAAAALPMQLAKLAEKSIALDDRIMELAGNLAAVIKDKLDTDSEMGRLSGSPTFRRTLSRSGVMVRNAIEPLFRIDPSRPSAAENNLLSLKSTLYGPDAHKSLRELDQPRFDDAMPYFLSEAAAGEAQARLAARHTATTIKQIGGSWMLIRHDELFTDRAEAERTVAAAARSDIRLAIVAHGPGFRVCPAAFADSEILYAAAAAG